MFSNKKKSSLEPPFNRVGGGATAHNSIDNDRNNFNQMNIKSQFVTNEYDDDEWNKDDDLEEREAFKAGFAAAADHDSRSRSRSRKQQPRQHKSPATAGKPKSIEEAAR